ncbi:hypothetical protein [Jejubacter calystegiae]|uniref:hypothetical protein n=1 Tax=Jejubacter calystegiae TaxID=2579935 RepID=UPI001F50292B|nr:hypothetical protein [Jejubacter calystegiae]
MSLLSIEQIPQTLAGMIASVTENRYGILNCSSVAFVKASVPYLEAFFLFIALLVIFPGLVLFLPPR